jgi:hypothetical protein
MPRRVVIHRQETPKSWVVLVETILPGMRIDPPGQAAKDGEDEITLE